MKCTPENIKVHSHFYYRTQMILIDSLMKEYLKHKDSTEHSFN